MEPATINPEIIVTMKGGKERRKEGRKGVRREGGRKEGRKERRTVERRNGGR